MRIHYSAVKVYKQTGRRYRVLGTRKWNKMYYTCDGFFDTRATSLAEAKRLAIAAGTMDGLDEAAKP
ncbi:MAG: hypothetical protein V9G18_00265 [Albidovulum sp.]